MKKEVLISQLDAAVANVAAALRKFDSATDSLRHAGVALKDAQEKRKEAVATFEADAVKQASIVVECAEAKVKDRQDKLGAAGANLSAIHRESSIAINEALNVVLSAAKTNAMEKITALYDPKFRRDALLDFRKVLSYREVEGNTRLGLTGTSLEAVEQEARHVLPSVADLLKAKAEELL